MMSNDQPKTSVQEKCSICGGIFSLDSPHAKALGDLVICPECMSARLSNLIEQTAFSARLEKAREVLSLMTDYCICTAAWTGFFGLVTAVVVDRLQLGFTTVIVGLVLLLVGGFAADSIKPAAKRTRKKKSAESTPPRRFGR